MTSKTLRRRLHHHDIDEREHDQLIFSTSDSLSEPLLGSSYGYSDRHVQGHAQGHASRGQEDNELWDHKKEENLHWTLLLTHVIAQWAQWIASIIAGSNSFIGRLLAHPSIQYGRGNSIVLSPLQEERLDNLRRRLEVPYDGSRIDHQDALRELWRLAYPGREVPPLKSELWKEMGWQGADPSTDFRGGGFISLENLVMFAKKYPESFQRLLHKQEGRRSEWEYPFAVAGINISFMLVQMLDLQSGTPSSPVGIRFLQLLALDEMAFDDLYCIAFRLMDAQWLAKRASYMEFNDVLKSTREQLERELVLEDVFSIKDLPSYNMLIQ